MKKDVRVRNLLGLPTMAGPKFSYVHRLNFDVGVLSFRQLLICLNNDIAYAAVSLAAISGWLIAPKEPAPVSAASPLRSIPVGMFEATIPNFGPAPNNAPPGMV
jgi:hypothetical protein